MVFVIRILEGPITWLLCVSLNYYEKCAGFESEEECSLHELMIQVRDNTLAILKYKNISDTA